MPEEPIILEDSLAFGSMAFCYPELNSIDVSKRERQPRHYLTATIYIAEKLIMGKIRL